MSISDKNYKKDYWIKENLAFSQVHLRLEKCARIVNSLANGRRCDLLDLGCGPATFAKLLDKNINYFGIDIAIQDPAPNLCEKDLLEDEIKFGDKTFDFIVALGFFEYMGNYQQQKFAEINKILKEGGKFILTYSNINHYNFNPDQPWNNMQSIDKFKKDLLALFIIDKLFITSHNRKYYLSSNRITTQVQKKISSYIPFISPLLALEYIMICSKKQT